MISFFPVGTYAPGTIVDNKFVFFGITRDAATKTVSLYINGIASGTYVDAGDLYLSPSHALRFFMDNTSGSAAVSESSAGQVALIRVINSPTVQAGIPALQAQACAAVATGGVCGDGYLTGKEGCDDGNTVAGDGCSATCLVENGTTCPTDVKGATGSPGCASGLCVSNAFFPAPGKCQAVGACGNGILDATEGCEDGNTTSNDGCSSACKVEAPQPCNTTAPGLTSNASCATGICNTAGGGAGICAAVNVCGNGVVEAGEGCDSGLPAGNATCTAACKIVDGSACAAGGDATCASGVCNVAAGLPGTCAPALTCGNGKVEAGEGCDSGLPAGNAACTATCKITAPNACAAGGNATCASGICNAAAGAPGVCADANVCGNGVVEAGEGCDSGLPAGNATCTATCKIVDGIACAAGGNATCASGICNAAAGAPGVCAAANVCGNAKVEAGEGCDSGLPAGNAACTATCKITAPNACAAGGNATCASGICNAAAGAPGVCANANVCGNGVVEAGESCDSGLAAGNATCSAACKIANGIACGAGGNSTCDSGVCNTASGAPGTCAAANVCGNGKLDAGEGCDSGLVAGNATCNATCKVTNGNACGAGGNVSCASGLCNALAQPAVCAAVGTCGNGVLDGTEGCDDGNKTGGDGCDGTCKVESGSACNGNAVGIVGNGSCATGICNALGFAPPGKCQAANVCGNGKLEAGEGCDDGNTANGDDCAANCTVETGAYCNNAAPGLLGATSCQSGICNTTAGAPGRCNAANACGNSVLEADEGCDDGNNASNDGCATTCAVENGSACNAAAPGNLGNTSCQSGVCNVTAGAPGVCNPTLTCGNGVLEAGEGCDDGNNAAADGCSATCKVDVGSACNGNNAGATGNGSCSSGICNTAGGAPGICSAPLACGNGVVEAGEGCDDGNGAAGDGCDATCHVESGRPCGTNAAGVIGDGSCATGVCDTTGNAAPGTCEAALTCGNGKLEAGEGCDDGNILAGDGCDLGCAVESGNACNANASGAVGGASCASGICNVVGFAAPGKCQAANVCGNSVLEAGEGCDDGNSVAGDGCDVACKVELGRACNGDGSGDVGAPSCASGVCNTAAFPAPGQCQAANVCGNGKLEIGEGCDDGNSVAHDGCSTTCKVENNGSCNADANGVVGSASCESGVCNSAGFAAPGKCQPANACGNGKLEAGEGCDDGNTAAGDGCSGLCTIDNGVACNANAAGAVGAVSCASGICNLAGGAPGLCSASLTCGNGVLEAGEGCDDGNKANDDGCNSACKNESGSACNGAAPGIVGGDSCASGVCNSAGFPAPGKCAAANTCGNGKIEPGEGCDDGNTTAGDGCSTRCMGEVGGSCNGGPAGLVEAAGCESGVCNLAGFPAPGKCAAANTCGNGKLEVGEGCDDGNTASGDGCHATCAIENGRPCNMTAPGTLANASCVEGICNATAGDPGLCSPANRCGNSKLEAGEGCDDGNTTVGDGCDSTCTIEAGRACNASEPGLMGNASCENGICNTYNGLPGVCAAAGVCGNAVVEKGEGCDDGNTNNSDGCASDCKIDVGQNCGSKTPGLTGATSCESGICNTSTGTPGLCAAPKTCGNHVLEAGEGCDDGNTAAGDGCDATCGIEAGRACGTDGAGATGNVSCASGICNTVAGQPGTCANPNVCGNGKLEANEACDDGNVTAKDGCNVSCKLEDGASCTQSTANGCESGYCGAANTCAPMPVTSPGSLEGGSIACSTATAPSSASPFAVFTALAAFLMARKRRSKAA